MMMRLFDACGPITKALWCVVWSCQPLMYHAVQVREVLSVFEGSTEGTSLTGEIQREGAQPASLSVSGGEWDPCPGSVARTLWGVSRNWKPPKPRADQRGKTADGHGHPLVFGGLGNQSGFVDAPELQPMESANASRVSDRLQESKDKMKELAQKVTPALTPLDTSTEEDAARLKAVMTSAGVLYGSELSSMQQIHNQGLLRGRMLAASSASRASSLDRVVNLNAAMRTLSYNDPSSFEMLIQQAPSMDAQEFVVESEDVAAAQRANSMISAFGASSFKEMDKSFAVDASASFLGASIKAGYSSGESEMSSSSSSSDSANSATTQHSTKTLSQSRYYLEPRMHIVLDKSMLTPDPGFLKESNSIARFMCGERGEQDCEKKWSDESSNVKSLPLASSICSADTVGSKQRSRTQMTYVRNLLTRFGSHVCPQAVLGGWWKITADLSSKSTMSATEASQAAARAIASAASSKSEGSLSGGFGGISGGMSASESEKEEEAESSESASSTASENKESSFNMQVNQTWRGGSSGLSLGEWRQSLTRSRSSEWKVIDRTVDKCIGVWTFMADNYSACAVCEVWLELFLAEIGVDKVGVSKRELKEACQSDGLMHGLISKAMSSQATKKRAENEWKANRCSADKAFKEFVFMPGEIEGAKNDHAGIIPRVSFFFDGSEVALSNVGNVPTFWYQEAGKSRTPTYLYLGKRACELLRVEQAENVDMCMRICNVDSNCRFIESSNSGRCTLFKACGESGETIADVFEKPETLWLSMGTQVIISFSQETPVEYFRFVPSRASDSRITKFKLFGGDVGRVLLTQQDELYTQGVGFGITETYSTYGLPWTRLYGAAGAGFHWDYESGQCTMNQCYCKDGGDELKEGATGKACPNHGMIDCPQCCKVGQMATCASMRCEKLGTHVNNPNHGDRLCASGSCSVSNADDVSQCCMDKGVSTRYVIELTACDVVLGGYWGPVAVTLQGESTKNNHVVSTPQHVEKEISIKRGGKASFAYNIPSSSTVTPSKICLKKPSWNGDSLCIQKITLQNPNLQQSEMIIGEARDLFDITERSSVCASIVRTRTAVASLTASAAHAISLADISIPKQHTESHDDTVARRDGGALDRAAFRGASTGEACSVFFFDNADCSGNPFRTFASSFDNVPQTFKIKENSSLHSFSYTETCASLELEVVKKDASVKSIAADASKHSKCWHLAPYEGVRSLKLVNDPCTCSVRFFSGVDCDATQEMATYVTSSSMDYTPLSNPQACRFDDESSVSKADQGQVGSMLVSSGCSSVSLTRKSATVPYAVGTCQNVQLNGAVSMLSLEGSCAGSEVAKAQHNCTGKTRWPSVSWLTSGFNIFKGDPFPNSGVLAGFGNAVFRIDYSEGTGSGDAGTCVPDGFDIKQSISSTYSVSSSLISTSDQYSDSVASAFGISGSVSASANGMGGSLAGSYSDESEKRTERASTNKLKLVVTSASDTHYTALLKSGRSVPQTDPNFEHEVAAASSQARYKYIFDSFGTHYMKKIQMGARFYDKFYVDEESFEEQLSKSQSSKKALAVSAEKELSTSAVSDAIGDAFGETAGNLADTHDWGDKDKVSVEVGADSSEGASDSRGSSEAMKTTDRVTTVIGGNLTRGRGGEMLWVKDPNIPPLPVKFDPELICKHQAFVLAGKVEDCEAAYETYEKETLEKAKKKADGECVWDSDCKRDKQKCYSGKCGDEPSCKVYFYVDNGGLKLDKINHVEHFYESDQQPSQDGIPTEFPDNVRDHVEVVRLSGGCKQVTFWDDDDGSECNPRDGQGNNQHVTKQQPKDCRGSWWEVHLESDLRSDTCGMQIWLHAYEDLQAYNKSESSKKKLSECRLD
eukprot:TRINITY_DN4062_c0_g6_i1.p1 TRINITY_DN4062_c0_g6~~TRINITY_DN4062_c0_g6_i1.p1  ORF type:complete len:1846 (-),score=225.98 TRINITY_DN4062_c0_g6_i1:77-5614(-)